MYIVDQDQINKIHNQLNGLQVYSFEGNSIIDPALDIGDLILVDGKYIIYQDSCQYSGKWKASISSKIQSKEKEETMSRTTSQKTINRRVESRIDQVEGSITQVIKENTTQNQKISEVTQTVNELNSKIGEIADTTISKESINGTVSFEKINKSEPIYIKVYPTVESIAYLHSHDNLYPSEELYLKSRSLRFINITNSTYVDYELPDNLLYYDAENYDEFILDYDARSCVINKKVEYNANGTTYVLEEPTTIEYEYPKIELEDGDYIVELLGYSNAYLFVRLMVQNIYTTQFATKVEVSSEISQTAESIQAEVNKKIGEDEIGTLIEQNAEAIRIAWNQISQYLKLEGVDGKASLVIYNDSNSKLMVLDDDGTTFYDDEGKLIGEMGIKTVDNNKYITFSTNGEYGTTTENGMAWGITTQSDNQFFPILYISNFNVANKDAGDYGGQLNLVACDLVLAGEQTGIISENIKIVGNILGGIEFVDNNSETTLLSIFAENSAMKKTINMLEGNITFYENQTGSYTFKIGTGENPCILTDEGYISCDNLTANSVYTFNDIKCSGNMECNGNIQCDGNILTQNNSSDARLKENIKDSDINATEILSELKVRSFDWIKDKKHTNAGFIAQEAEKVSDDFILKQAIYDNNQNLVDTKYYMNILPIVATLVKGFQEQQELIEQLQNEIKELKGEK